MLADGVQEAVVDLPGALDVDGADDRQDEPAARQLQHGRRELEDGLGLGALELGERVAQPAVRVAEAYPPGLQLGAPDRERVRHRVERAGQRADLAGAGLGGACGGVAARQLLGREDYVAHGGHDDAQEVGEGERDGREQQ